MNKELYDLVTKYYRNQLSDDERTQFEQKIRTDEVFAKEAKSYAQMYEVIQEYGDRMLNEKLTALGKEMMQESQPSVFKAPFFTRFKIYWATAAAVLIVGVVIIRYFFSTAPLSAEKLYTENYRRPVISETAARSGSEEELWIKAAQAYGAENFDTASVIFEKLISDSTFERRSEAWLFLGITRMEQNRFQEAVAAFSQVDPTNMIITNVRWYMALSYLKMNQLAKAKTLFNRIAYDPPKSEHTESAKNILAKFSQLN
ncbi:MAG: tetratricopeptide repeat protein [Bacteroidia bacterium]|nr:tetratricopeptide repeat protein [Bacteroidia bacterium]